jgi:hypothetical protein
MNKLILEKIKFSNLVSQNDKKMGFPFLIFCLLFGAYAYGMLQDQRPYAIIFLALLIFVFVGFRDAISKVDIFLSIFFIGFGAIFFWFTPDFSWDGNAYHLIAIESIGKKIQLAIDPDQRLDIRSYPKGAWYMGYSFSQIFGNINLSRLSLYFAMLFNFSLLLNLSRLYSYNLKDYSTIIKYAVLLCIMVTPVYICQLYTNYVDYLLYLILLSIGVLVLIYIKNNSLISLCMAIFLIGISGSIKFNGLPLAGIFFLCILFIILRSNNNLLLIPLITISVLSLIDPYLLNLINNGHIFYPIYGTNKIDVITPASPWLLAHQELPEFIRGIQVIFLKYGNVIAEYKYPWNFYNSEFQRLGRPDTISGGQGLLGPSIFILFIVYWLALLWQQKFKLAIIFIAILFLSFLYPGASFARYNFFYPLLPFVFIVLQKVNYISIVIITLATINIAVSISAGFAFQLLRQERYNFILKNPSEIIVGLKTYTPQYINTKGLMLDETRTGIFILGCFESKFKIILPKNMGNICNDRLL